MQNKAQIESFLHNQMKPMIEKSNKHGSYSLWEDVQKADESVCGVYLTYSYLRSQLSGDNKKVKISFPVTIGFDMLLPLPGFNFFPNSIFGKLDLIIKVSPHALVWACTDAGQFGSIRHQTLSFSEEQTPVQFAKVEEAFRSPLPVDATAYYDHRFTQVRTTGLARSNCVTSGSGYYVSALLRLTPDAMITREAKSTILGFSLKDSVKGAFAQYYSNAPFVIPSERIVVQSFTTGPTDAGLNCSITTPIIKGKEVIAMFPRDANDLTCMRNPEYHHLMFTMLDRNFPATGANTNSAEFFRMETESCNLDTILTPTESFENSYLSKVNMLPPGRERCRADDTDFLFLFNLERQSSNAFFSDPVDSSNETIQLTGSPQAQGFAGDTYYYLARESETADNVVNHTCPVLAIVSDSFWLFSANQRAVYEINSGWNEALAKHFPQRLAS
jgi:hypothetical protein